MPSLRTAGKYILIWKYIEKTAHIPKFLEKRGCLYKKRGQGAGSSTRHQGAGQSRPTVHQAADEGAGERDTLSREDCRGWAAPSVSHGDSGEGQRSLPLSCTPGLQLPRAGACHLQPQPLIHMLPTLWVPGWHGPACGRGGLWTLLWGVRCLPLVLLANHVSGESRDVSRAVGGGTTAGLPWGTFPQPPAQANLPSGPNFVPVYGPVLPCCSYSDVLALGLPTSVHLASKLGATCGI